MDFLRGKIAPIAPKKIPLPQDINLYDIRKRDISVTPGKHYYPDEQRHDYSYSMYGPPDRPMSPNWLNLSGGIMSSVDPTPYNVKNYKRYNEMSNTATDYLYSGGHRQVPVEEIFAYEIFTMPAPNGLFTHTHSTRF